MHRPNQDAEQPFPAQPATEAHSVLEQIERSESLPAQTSAAEAFETVIGTLVQRLPAKHAIEFVERRLPADLSSLLERDVEEALDDGVAGDLADYVGEVAGRLDLSTADARELIDAVIGSLRSLMSAEEVDAIAGRLSPQLATMWLRASNVPGAPGHSGSP